MSVSPETGGESLLSHFQPVQEKTKLLLLSEPYHPPQGPINVAG
tara:strand:- start:8009 stop:8140 length:132 start_codon:yes stop_codon:yes gene_type:complete